MVEHTPMMRWLDFSAHGVKLRLFRQTDNSVNLVLTGVKPGSAEWAAVQELGFVPSASGKTMVRQGQDVRTRALRDIFPRNALRDMPVSSVWVAVKGQAPLQAPTAPADHAVLGRNAQGLTVHIRNGGGGERYVAGLDGHELTESDDRAQAAMFLRAPEGDALALAQCADAFVGEMLAGRNMDSTDLRQYGGVIFAQRGQAARTLDVSDGRLRPLQEAVEAAMQRSLAEHHAGADAAAYKFAVGLTERQPIFGFRTSTSVINQQYSTPLPMSIAAQAILGDTAGKSVLEPTIGNGSLVTALPADTAITGVEIDPARVAQVEVLLAGRPNATVVSGDVMKIGAQLAADFDFVVSNPPFGGLDKPVQFENMRVNRIDHLIMLNALARRKEAGRGVFIIAADRESVRGEPGKIAGGSKSFFAWLADHYEIEDAIELDGALFKKQGAEYPVRMVTVGRRRTPEQAEDLLKTKAARLGDRLPVINTWDELWTHAQALTHRLQEGKPIASENPVVEFGTAMRQAGLEMDSLDPRSWTVEIAGGYEVHANLVDKDSTVNVYSFVDGQIAEEWSGTLGAEMTRQVEAFIHRASDAVRANNTQQAVEHSAPTAARGEPHAPPATAGGEVNQTTTAEHAVSTSPATQPAAASEAKTTAEPDEEPVINDYQAPYLPSSQLNEPSAMIPRNLEGPVRRALARLVEEIGIDVDAYVSTKLQMDPEDMELAFSAEQVDAIALAIKRTEEGRGFINGDQTGQGKGRVLAALARYSVLNGVPVVFNTEKANLFSDFWRDLKDIDSAHLFRPLILNDGEAIRNMETGDIEHRSIKPGALKALMDADVSLADTDYNLMLSTYSQFNRERSVSKKAAWFPAAAKGAMMLVDESHVAAGESNTADNMGLAVDLAGSCVYSSATFAKGAKNMRAYAKVFPPSVTIASLADTLQAGGEPLQEVLSAMLAEEGVFIRREHDLSKLEFNVVMTEHTRERDEQWADALSDALRSMAYFSGDITRVMKRMDKNIKKELKKLPEEARKGNRMGVSYQSFGSRLYNILRQFSLALKVDTVADESIKALQEGRKPVIVLEQTFEALLKEALSESTSENSLSTSGDGEEPSVASQIAENVLSTMPGAGGRTVESLTFRDLMSRIAKRLEYIYVRDDYGNGHYEHATQQAENKDELEAILGAIDEIKEKIALLPNIPVSPIDTIRQKLQEAGFSHGEISGRQFQTDPVEGDPEKIQVTIRPDQRIASLAAFNNGGIDALTLTRAGSTGLSAHSSAKFGDQRQREMLELQIANNVAERVQFFGRVNRRGQVSSPRITTVVTALPSEMRTLAMQNAKLRKLSANTQSNRNNQAEMRDVPDILNPVGNEICRRYLEENPDIAALLDIDPEEEGASDDEAWFANKLTGRIALLPVARQKSVYADLSRTFQETLKELEARGENPFQTTVHDWGAKIVSRERFRADGAGNSNSVFDEPMYLARVEWEQDLVPYTSEDVKSMLERSRRFLAENDNRFKLVENRYSAGEHDRWIVSTEGLTKDINAAFDQIQARALKSLSNFSSIQEALASDESNPIKNSQSRRDWLCKTLRGLMPGNVVQFADPEGQPVKGMISAFYPPVERSEAHLLGQYEIRVVVPGSDKVHNFTLNHLIGDPQFALEYSLGTDYRNPLREFDEAKPGRITFSRQVLLGNMFMASQFAAQHRLGSAGIFTDETGARHRAVILYSMFTREDVMSMPVQLNKKQISKVLERACAEGYSVQLSSTSIERDENATILSFERTRPNELAIIAPGSKAHGGMVFANARLLKITGDFTGNRNKMRATVGFQRMEQVVEALITHCGRTFWLDAKSADRLMPSTPDVGADSKAIDVSDSAVPTAKRARMRVVA